MPEIWGPPLICLAVGVGLGWLFLHLSRRQDRKNFVYQRAPRLPVKVLQAHDDAWIRGQVEVGEPLTCPRFGTSCVYYSYRIERQVTRVTRDSKGRTRTRTTWQTEHSERKAIPFWLVDETSGIFVEAEQASFKHLSGTGYDYEWSTRRHSATLLPVEETVSILGVVIDGNRFAPYQEIPLIVTTREPSEFLTRGDRGEWWLRAIGFFSLFAAGVVAAYLFPGFRYEPANHLIPPLIGLGVLAPFWLASTYNRLVRQHQQAEAAWRQIDVDVGVRAGVIPQVVAVVEGYRDHERALFERIAQLRTDARAAATAAEKEGRDVAAGLLALVERHPELKSNELFMDLHEKLWALEEKIAASRGFYNKIAKEWNDLVQGFPSVLVAKPFGWGQRPYFA